jgi:hypothetical protein
VVKESNIALLESDMPDIIDAIQHNNLNALLHSHQKVTQIMKAIAGQSHFLPTSNKSPEWNCIH